MYTGPSPAQSAKPLKRKPLGFYNNHNQCRNIENM
jgi:hypothetical protein